VNDEIMSLGPQLTLSKRHAKIQQGLADRVLLGQHLDGVRDFGDRDFDSTFSLLDH
jgi:hypothetical protein